MADLSSRASSSSLGEGFGQEEPITVRIRNILAEYPVTNLIKELLQNADDARATRVKLIIDKRWHPTTRLIEPKLAALQGPALIAYNDAPFTDSDFANIRRLGASKKRGDPGVTGRFGIGFNSVYHVTDIPSFISGTQLAFLDPHELIWQSRGIKFDMTSTVSDTCQTLFESYSDQFAGFQTDTLRVDGTAVTGTLFRLPLRTNESRAPFPEISDEDTVSDVTWTAEDLERLFTIFRQEAHLILLFLRSVEQIDFLIWHEDQVVPQQLFTVALSQLSDTDRALRAVLHDPEQPIRRYSLNVTLRADDHVTSEVYRVVTCSQSLSADEARDIGLSDKELRKLIPWGGVATRLHRTAAKTDHTQSRDQQSHVFCSLPVTLSGLPVHLNGCFELSASRTALSWHEYARKDHWNRHVLTAVVSRAYMHLLHDCRQLLTTAEYYALFPNVNHVLHDWERYFCTQLARVLHDEHVIRFKDAWITPNKAIWPGSHVVLGEALRTWLMDNYPLVETPDHMLALFAHVTELQSHRLTPVTLITWLAGHDDWLLALRTNTAVYNQLWQLMFTLPDEEYVKVYEVPLLFTESGTLVRMSDQSSHVPYYVIRSARLRQIFAEIRSSLIDVSLFTETVLSKLIETRFMNARNIEHVTTLESHLHVLLPPVANDCKVIARDANSFPRNDWLKLVWQYLAAENCDLSAYDHVPLIPVDNGAGLVPVRHSSHVINISARDGDQVPVHVLQQLQCHVLDADLQREITQSRATLCSADPAHVMQLLATLHGTQLGSKVTALSSEHKRDLRRYFVRTIKQWHVTSREHAILKQLQIFELVGTKNSNRFVSLAQYKSRASVQCHVLDISLPLIDCALDETAFFDSIGVPPISTVELFRAHLFIDQLFQTLTSHQQRELLQTLFKTSTLKNCDAEFLELVRNYPCITCQDGKLRALNAIYDPDNKAVTELLALARDCCHVVPLPEQYWQESTQRGVFLAGMRLVGFCHVLRVQDLQTLLLTLQHMPASKAVSLATKLFRYVVSQFSELQSQGVSLEFLRHVPWLPLYRPISHVIPPFSELQDDTCLVSPLSSQPRARQSLVSAVMPLASVDLPSRDHPFVQYVEWHLPISVSSLVQQLKAVAKLFLALTTKPAALYLQELEHVIHEIYGHLDEQLAISPDLAEVLQRNVAGTEHVIWTGTQFVTPQQVALTCQLQIKPWAMKVPPKFAQFKHVTQHIGFMKQFGAEHYLHIVSELHAQYGGTALSAKHLKQVLKIVTYLGREILTHGADHVPLDHVLVPTTAGVLKSARTVVYQSRDTALGSQPLSHDLVHAEIAPEYCRALGIAPMDKLLLQDCIRPFGQRQELVHRLKNVLVDYPPSSLIAEMLQNADDAGATQFRVVYDAEQYPTNQLALPLHALLETPALVFMNDAAFSEADLQALILISKGSKQHSATTIGRYGLGFNAVYNVTDTPMLLTGDQLVVFDPQLEYLRSWSSDKEPGVCIQFTAPNHHVLNGDLLAPFRHFGVDPTRPFNGTIFRLPLRAKKSKISPTIWTEEHVLDLLRKFSALGTAPMIFLQHVEQVRVQSRDKLGDTQYVQHLVEVKSPSNSPPHSRALLEQFTSADHVAGMLAHRLTIHSTYSGLSSHHHVTEHQEWQVCHQCATSPDEDARDKLPIGGVAHCLSDVDKSRAGRLFCFLPLPINLSLPMFINGYFQLSSARTSLTQGTWNEILRDGPIFDCYWHSMMNLRKDSPAAYWAVFPQSVHDSKDFWNPLVTRVYQQLAREPSLFVMESHRLVQPRDAIYYGDQARDQGLDETLRNYLLQVLHVPLVACPRHVIEEFKRVDVTIANFSPKVLREFIKQHVINLEYSAEALQVLQYCLEDLKPATAAELLGLPLLPVKSRALVRFSTKSPCILVHSLNEYELFPPTLHARLVDIEVVPRNLVQISCADMGVIPLSLDVLLDLVSEILPTAYHRQHVINHPAPSVLQWLYHFWQWIRRQCVTWPGSLNQSSADSSESLIDTLCSRLHDWPIVPTVSEQLVTPNTPLFYQGSLPAEHFELTLAHRLNCQFIDTQQYHVPVEFTERLYLPNMLNILKYSAKSRETLARFSELSPIERDRALTLIAQLSDSEIDVYCALIRQLPLFPLVHELPQRLTDLALLAAANYSREVMAPELWQQTRDTLNTFFYTAVIVPLRASAVALLRDQSLPPVPLNTAVPFIRLLHARLYKRLGVRAVSSADYLTNHVLPHLAQLDDPNMVLEYIAEHWLQLREFSPLLHALRNLAFVAHGTGSSVCARDLYHPEHVIYRVLFAEQPEQFPAEPYNSVTWLSVLRDLGMHVTPSADDVIRAAQILAEKLSFDYSDPQLLQSLQSFWGFVLEEKLLQSLPQLRSLKLVVALWDHRERIDGGISATNHVRIVVPLNDVGFDIERELIWTQQPIIDSEVFGSNLVNELFMQHRTVANHVTPLDIHLVYSHLTTVLQRVRDRARDQSVCGNVFVHEQVVRQYELEPTFRELWRFMNSQVEALSDALIAQLQSLPWLLITQQSRSYLVAPKNIFANVSARLIPLWFALPNLYTTHELAVRVTRGVEPSTHDARVALRQLHESRVRILPQSPEGDTAHVTVDLVLELMRLAATRSEDELAQSQMELPVLNEHHVLVPASHVFIRDRHVSHFQIDTAVQFLHCEVSRDLGLALGVQLFSQIIEERVVSHVTVESSQRVADELLQSHRELQEIVARLRSPIFADVLALILRAQNPTLSELTIAHSVNQIKKLRVVYCSEISTQLVDRRNNSVLSQSRVNTAMLVQQDQIYVANKPRFIRWSDLLAQQLNKFLNFMLTDLLSLSAVLNCEERDMIACCLAVETSSPK